MSAQPPTGAPVPDPLSTRPVVTVTIGKHRVLHIDGDQGIVQVVSFADHPRIVAALAHAIGFFTLQQPELSPLVAGVDAVERLAAQADPFVAREGREAIEEAITDFRDRIESTSAARIPN